MVSSIVRMPVIISPIFLVLMIAFLTEVPRFLSAQRARIPQKWTNGIVPFNVSSRFTPAELKTILEVLPVFNQQTCIHFKPLKGENSYLQISLGTLCQSSIGRVGGAQILTLGRSCLNKRSILRELMHALGFNDEHLRSDRDSAITINYNNIRDQDRIFFQPLTDAELPRFSQPYDYDSVLQVPANWKVDPAAPAGSTTVIPKTRGLELGRAQTLTHLDINKIKSFYGC